MRVRKRDEESDHLISSDDEDDRKDKLFPSSIPFKCNCGTSTHNFNEVPLWMVRPFIIRGYRSNLSWSDMIMSLLYCHNESGNIWSHLLGCCIVLLISMGQLDEFDNESEVLPNSKVVIRIFLTSAAASFCASSVYHTGNCCQEEAICSILLRGDVTGIAVLVAASFLPGVYFGFACFPGLQFTYLILVSFLLVVGLFVSCLDCGVKSRANVEEEIDGKEDSRLGALHRIRVATFVSFVSLGLIVALHWCFLVAYEARMRLFPKVLIMLLLYGIGFAFYSSKVPERWSPGTFDFVLQSHQIWHVCVVGAVLIWYLTCCDAARLHSERGCEAFIRVETTNQSGQVLFSSYLGAVGLRGAVVSSKFQ